MNMYAHACTHLIYINIYIYVYTHAYTYIHTCTQTQTTCTRIAHRSSSEWCTCERTSTIDRTSTDRRLSITYRIWLKCSVVQFVLLNEQPSCRNYGLHG